MYMYQGHNHLNLEGLFFGGRNLEGLKSAIFFAPDDCGKNWPWEIRFFSLCILKEMEISRALMLAWLVGTVAAQTVRFLAPQARCCSA